MKMHTLAAALVVSAISAGPLAAAANAGDEPFIGEIAIVGEPFCPRGWARADGQVMSISQNTALFSLLGIRYGGDGSRTFALPDLRGRAPVGYGGPVAIASSGGSETATMSTAQMPVHLHSLNASDRAGANTSPAGNDLAEFSVSGQMIDAYAATTPGTVAMAPETIGLTGQSTPFAVRQPYLGITYCIATMGVFPPRQ